MIELKNISKTFKVARRSSGMKEATKSFFNKKYEYIEALKNISFKINDGEMVAYIGPNGAGKSSTIKIMSGILNPDSGECFINNRTPWKDRINHVREIGVVFGQRSQLWWDVPVVDSFELLKDIYSIPQNIFKENINTLSHLLNIENIIKTPARQLSLGQRMRCEIVASLLHNPKILFLDEPTIGLDAVSKIAVRDFIRKINKEKNTTVILTTHDMQDIEALTERIILIGKGQILMDGSLEKLKKEFSTYKTITIEFVGKKPILLEGMKFIECLSERAIIEIDTNIISVSSSISHLTNVTNANDISVSGTSVEDIVLSLYKEYNI